MEQVQWVKCKPSAGRGVVWMQVGYRMPLRELGGDLD